MRSVRNRHVNHRSRGSRESRGSCPRCGYSLSSFRGDSSFVTDRWRVKEFSVLRCSRCGGLWLISDSLNCPVLLRGS